MTEPVVTIEDGVKRYGTKLALNRVNLQLERGMRCGLLGPNGAGKSTLIRTLTGILRLDKGQVSVLGESPEAARSRVGYLPEERGVPRRAKVGEWLAFLGKLRGLTAQEAKKSPPLARKGGPSRGGTIAVPRTVQGYAAESATCGGTATRT